MTHVEVQSCLEWPEESAEIDWDKVPQVIADHNMSGGTGE